MCLIKILLYYFQRYQISPEIISLQIFQIDQKWQVSIFLKLHVHTMQLNFVPKTLFCSAKICIRLCCKSHDAENINEFGLKNSRVLDIKGYIPEENSFNTLTLRGYIHVTMISGTMKYVLTKRLIKMKALSNAVHGVFNWI